MPGGRRSGGDVAERPCEMDPAFISRAGSVPNEHAHRKRNPGSAVKFLILDTSVANASGDIRRRLRHGRVTPVKLGQNPQAGFVFRRKACRRGRPARSGRVTPRCVGGSRIDCEMYRSGLHKNKAISQMPILSALNVKLPPVARPLLFSWCTCLAALSCTPTGTAPRSSARVEFHRLVAIGNLRRHRLLHRGGVAKLRLPVADDRVSGMGDGGGERERGGNEEDAFQRKLHRLRPQGSGVLT